MVYRGQISGVSSEVSFTYQIDKMIVGSIRRTKIMESDSDFAMS